MRFRTLSVAFFLLAASGGARAADPDALQRATQRVVKLYGAGGVGRAQGYGSAVLVSPQGHLLTVMGSMLEATELRAVLWDGRRLPVRLLAAHPKRSIAVLKIDVEEAYFFDLSAPTPEPGEVVFCISNQFNIAAGAESASIQRGVVAAVATLDAAAGPSLILDATACNPGAAGGAVVDAKGRLLAILAKEHRDAATRTWIHSAIPLQEISPFVRAVVAGKVDAPTLDVPPDDAKKSIVAPVDLRGLTLLPNLLDQTPAFVDGAVRGSPAEKAGFRPDDLILYVGPKLVQSVVDFQKAAAQLPADKPWSLVVLRGDSMITLELPPRSTPHKDLP